MNQDEGGLYVVVVSRRLDGTHYYSLDRSVFDQINNRITQNVRNTIDTDPVSKLEKIRGELQDARKEIQRLKSEKAELEEQVNSFS